MNAKVFNFLAKGGGGGEAFGRGAGLNRVNKIT